MFRRWREGAGDFQRWDECAVSHSSATGDCLPVDSSTPLSRLLYLLLRPPSFASHLPPSAPSVQHPRVASVIWYVFVLFHQQLASHISSSLFGLARATCRPSFTSAVSIMSLTMANSVADTDTYPSQTDQDPLKRITASLITLARRRNLQELGFIRAQSTPPSLGPRPNNDCAQSRRIVISMPERPRVSMGKLIRAAREAAPSPPSSTAPTPPETVAPCSPSIGPMQTDHNDLLDQEQVGADI